MLSLSLSNWQMSLKSQLSVSFHTYLKDEYNTGIESFFYL
jgi:hypothetical protein